jgi:hypothetical protein
VPRVIVAKIYSGVRTHLSVRFAEWGLSYILLKFGLALLGEGDTFATSTRYEAMRAMASEDTWGWCITLLALMRFLALTINGSFNGFSRLSPYVRAACATLSCFVWFLITLGLYTSGNRGDTGWGTYSGLLMIDFMVAYFVAGDAGKYERARRQQNGRP